MTTEQENNPLLDFSWDSDINLNDVLSEEETEDVIEQENVQEEVEEETSDNDIDKRDEIKKPNKDKEEEELEEFDFNNNKKEPKKNKPKENTSIYDDVYKDLKSYGVLKHVNIEEDESLTPERLEELYQQDYEAEVNERINNWANKELDEEAQAFIKFKMNGGSTKDFLDFYGKDEGLPEGDIDDEDFQDEIIRYQLKQEDYDHEEIEDVLETLTNNGRKKQRAERYYNRIEQQKAKERQELLSRQEQERKRAIEQDTMFKNDVKKILTDNKEIGGLKVTDKEKGEIFNFLTKKDVKVNDSYSITGFQKKLAETFKDTNKLVLLAKILNSDFNFDSFKRQVETATTKKVKSNLENRKGLNYNSVGSSMKSVNLSEIFSGI